jgi:uncharacterized membrane protein YgcG
MTDLTDTLDIALEKLRKGEALLSVLEAHASQAPDLQALLSAAAALEPLRQVEMPAPERQLADRNRFLAELARTVRQPASPSLVVRLRRWLAQVFAWQAITTPVHRREPRRMNALMLKFVLVVTMLFGSAGGTAFATANSLPGSRLYPAKLAVERARLQVAASPTDRAQLHMILAQARVKEMEQLAVSGREPGEEVMTQLQQHLEQALQLAAGMPDEAMRGTLAQWQHQIQQQEQALQQAEAQAAGPAQERLRQALGMLQQMRQQLQAGLEDAQGFRWQHGYGSQPEESGPGAPGGPGEGTCVDCEPAGEQHQYGSQPEERGPDDPGGPGDGTCDECVPEGDQHQYGQQPDQPGPGGPGGPVDVPCDDCAPAGDQHQYGAQPEESGPESPGGPGNGTCDDCVPEGDQQQYGPQPEESGPESPGGPGNGTCDDCVPEGDQQQYGPQPDQPGSGGPGGATEPPSDDGEPDGDQHQYGQQSTEPGAGDGAGDGGAPGGQNGGSESGGGGRSG